MKASYQCLLVPQETLVHLVTAECVELRADGDLLKDDLVLVQRRQQRVPLFFTFSFRVSFDGILQPCFSSIHQLIVRQNG